MKNRYHLYILFFCISFFNISFVASDEFNFNTSEMVISDNGNIIETKKGSAKSSIDGINIDANSFLYNKNTSTLTALGDVKITSLKNDFLIETQGIIYNTFKKEITSTENIFINDTQDNLVEAKGFALYLNDDIIKLEQMKMLDVQQNLIELDIAYLNLNTKKLIGKDVSVSFNNKTYNKENEPRLKGVSLKKDSQNSIITKGVFTTCKKNDDCPPWQLQAEKIRHDKEKKTIYYDNAWLKVYDKPIFYFPKFFHPDPSVKRQSGFLMPKFYSSSNLGTALNLPYFNAISDNKDLTFTPRLYFDKKILAQTEYRTINADTKNTLDFSYLNNPDGNNEHHFFSQSKKQLNLNSFIESNLYLNIERSSDDTFLKAYKIESPIINNTNNLQSLLGLQLNKEDFSFNTEFKVYENLEAQKTDRYEYILPTYSLTKELGNNIGTNGTFRFASAGFVKNYDTNILEKNIVNDLIYDSNYNYSKNGLQKNYKILLKNANSDSENSPTYKNKRDHTIGSLFQYNVSYPLIKSGTIYTDLLTPITSLQISPNKSKNNRDADVRINADNIFSLNRTGNSNSVEGGLSLAYGFDYHKTNMNNQNVIEAKIANQIRLKEDNNVSINSSLGQKTSNIVGNFSINPSDYISLNYDYSIDENLKNTKYQSLSSSIKVNNLITTFEYVNENDSIKNSFLSNATSYNIDENKMISFRTRKNKETNITEYYNLIYQYKNDCLIAGLEYNKDYYSDRSLKPNESIFFKLTIIPFGETRSPNLRK